MQQRQLRLGDILDDYCPRERRVTNHAIVAMVGEDVKQTRCTTCEAEHVYKQARVPRQRRKDEAPAALYAQVAAGAPKRVAPPHQSELPGGEHEESELPAAVDEAAPVEAEDGEEAAQADQVVRAAAEQPLPNEPADEEEIEEARDDAAADEGPVHRPLIRASLPRQDGQQPPSRPIPEFTIRQPGGGRPGRFRPRHQRGGQGGGQGHQGHQFHGGNQGNRSNGNVGGPMRGPRPNGGRPGMMKRQGPPGRKRSK